jgi:hypothetical protein
VPTLRRYVPSSDNYGFYLQANVGGGAPITLQVSQLAAQIFTDNGYGDDDTVPTKLVWAMYDVGLVSTSGSTSAKGKSANVYRAFAKNGVSARLSEQTRKSLVQYLTDYQGPQKGRVRQLRTELTTGNTKNDRGSTSNVDISDLGYGIIDSLRVIWRHILARFSK